MLKNIFHPDRLHGTLFDGAVFLGNLSFLSLIPTIGDETLDQTAGMWLLLAVAAQFAGAWWKRGYLAPRLAQRDLEMAFDNPFSGLMDILLGLHFLLFTVITLFALLLVGIYDAGKSGVFWRGDVWVLISLAIGAAAASSVWAAERWAPDDKPQPAGPAWLEYGADVLLWVSVFIVTRTFWGGLLVLIEPSQGRGFSSVSVVLLIALTLLYTFFYLPARYLFLAEDAAYPRTWLQVWASMLPVVWFVLVG